jgi:hypothetical protein
LDAEGHLAEAGWARYLVKAYDRASIRASALRIKEWDYYCVLNDRFGAAFTLADNGYMGFVSVSLLDLVAGAELSDSIMIPFPLGSLKAPASSAAGDFAYRGKKISLRFLVRPGKRIVEIEWPEFGSKAKGGLARRAGLSQKVSLLDGRRGLSGRLELGPPPRDSMVIATPFKEKRTAFYYNQKINCMKASGTLLCGALPVEFKPSDSSAVLDWGRGVWTYSNTWYWASASSRIGSASFGFNLGYGFGDSGAASENMLFYGGVAHKLGRTAFAIDPDSFLKPWKISSDDERLELDFVPILDRASDTDLLLLRSNQHQVFGRFSGRAVLDSGKVLKLRDILGFAEKVANRW